MHEFWETAATVAFRGFLKTPKKGVIAVCLLGYLAGQVQQVSAGNWEDSCNQNLTLGKPCYISYFTYSGPNSDYRQYRWTAKSPDSRIRLSCGYVNLPWSDNCMDARISVQLGNDIVRFHCGTDWFIEQSTGNIMIVTLVEYSVQSEFRCSLLPIRPEDEACTCGRRNPTRIVGGTETGVDEFPMMAGLAAVYQGFGGGIDVFCGATIISPRYVITASHCLAGRDLKELAIIVGVHNITKGSTITSDTQVFRVLGAKIHPRYNSGSSDYSNDIAIIETNGTIKFSARVGPACLPLRYARNSFASAHVTALGWGLLEFAGEKADSLRKVQLDVITNQECSAAYRIDASKLLCTFTPGKDSCQMDSGGPCLWENSRAALQFLVGIISGGSGCANNSPGINQRVTSYFDWIIDVTPDAFYCIK